MNRQKRYQLQVPILLPSQLAGRTMDLGERGIGFVSSRPFAVGEQLQIQVMLPLARPLTMRAQVLWCKNVAASPTGHGFRCGARLSAMGLRDSLFLRAYLAGDLEPALAARAC